MMKIEELCNAVSKKHYEIKTESVNSDYVPKIAIYMDYEYWRECVDEIKGAVAGVVFEFYDHNTVMGYPVWKVAPTHGRDGEKVHAPFSVVNLDS
jgi:hypothetical protein